MGILRTPVDTAPTLLPVSLTAASEGPLVELPNPPTRFGNVAATTPIPSIIVVQIADVMIRVEGEVDVVRLRAVLPAVRG